MAQHIALYGKGGVGKTTLAVNMSAALAETGNKVLLVSCDPKAETGALLHVNEQRETILGILASGRKPVLTELVMEGFAGIRLIEVGDLLATGECASLAITRALTLLDELNLVDELGADFVIYDIPGEVICAGRSCHSRGFPVQQAYIVISSDLASFHAANSYLRMLEGEQGKGTVVAGLVANGLAGPFEETLVNDFARNIEAELVSCIPRSLVIRQCDLYGQTVIEAAPLSNLAYYYRRLAQHVSSPKQRLASAGPKPMGQADMKQWARGWGDRINELEFGLIREGEGI